MGKRPKVGDVCKLSASASRNTGFPRRAWLCVEAGERAGIFRRLVDGKATGARMVFLWPDVRLVEEYDGKPTECGSSTHKPIETCGRFVSCHILPSGASPSR